MLLFFGEVCTCKPNFISSDSNTLTHEAFRLKSFMFVSPKCQRCYLPVTTVHLLKNWTNGSVRPSFFYLTWSKSFPHGKRPLPFFVHCFCFWCGFTCFFLFSKELRDVQKFTATVMHLRSNCFSQMSLQIVSFEILQEPQVTTYKMRFWTWTLNY